MPISVWQANLQLQERRHRSLFHQLRVCDPPCVAEKRWTSVAFRCDLAWRYLGIEDRRVS